MSTVGHGGGLRLRSRGGGPAATVPRPAASSAAGATPIRGACVVGAHPGAGATTVAVALADALDAIGRPGTLLDLAPSPDAFAAAECEVDLPGAGLASGATRADPGAAPAYARGGGPEVLERPCRRRSDGVAQEPGPGLPGHTPKRPPSDTDLPDGAVLAVVGCSRWPKVVAASLGPTLQRAMSDGRIVFFPHDRDLELNGVDAEPLPSSARAAGRHVIELLWPDLVGPSAPHRWKGRRR